MRTNKTGSHSLIDHHNDNINSILLVPCNSTLTLKDELVMGAGFAKAVKLLRPELPKLAGAVVKRLTGHYYMLYFEEYRIALIQTKTDWRKNTTSKLLKESLERLNLFAQLHHRRTINGVVPGVGRGGLKLSEVVPLLKSLPNNVVFWL